jgi:hypothetical protein
MTTASCTSRRRVPTEAPGSIDGAVLAVDDIDAARDELLSRGVDVSEVFHDAGGGLGGGFIADTEARAPGADPQGRSYASYASFSDPEDNRWLLQEITERLPAGSDGSLAPRGVGERPATCWPQGAGYLRFAEAVNRLDLREADDSQGLPELLESVT